jgi:hypothetical protein
VGDRHGGGEPVRAGDALDRADLLVELGFDVLADRAGPADDGGGLHVEVGQRLPGGFRQLVAGGEQKRRVGVAGQRRRQRVAVASRRWCKSGNGRSS